MRLHQKPIPRSLALFCCLLYCSLCIRLPSVFCCWLLMLDCTVCTWFEFSLVFYSAYYGSLAICPLFRLIVFSPSLSVAPSQLSFLSSMYLLWSVSKEFISNHFSQYFSFYPLSPHFLVAYTASKIQHLRVQQEIHKQLSLKSQKGQMKLI